MEEIIDEQSEQEIEELVKDITEIMGINFRQCDSTMLANGLYKRNYRKIKTEE